MSQDTESAAVAAVHAFLDAFNAQDHEALAASLNYPHVRLANGEFVVTETADEFIKNRKRLEPALVAEGWHHTTTADIKVIQSGPDKVHITLKNDRCHEDGTVYNRFDTLWIATLQDGHWGIQFRSSYLR